MSILELNEKAGAIAFGAKVILKGFFVMDGQDGYFVESDARVREKNRAVLVRHDDLKGKLLSSVPAFGGGHICMGIKLKLPVSYRNRMMVDFFLK
ncbi:hypothetical protein ACVHYJ_09545 [Burkholderia pyrrocinia]